MTGPYSPDTASAEATGTTSLGYVVNSAPGWDDGLHFWNTKAVAMRSQLVAVDARDNMAALRAELRAAAGTTTAPVKILAAGDSITQGGGSSDLRGYRGWLTDLLDRRRITATVPVQAANGGTLRGLTPVMPAALAAATPDIVLLDIGTNDAAQPDMVDWQNRYATLVDLILASSPTVRVACARIAISLGPISASEATINTYIDAVVAARTSTGRVVSADMTVIDSSWTGDGVHPLDAGYLRMAQQWAAAIGPWLPTP